MKFSMNGSSAAIVACALIAGAAVTNLHAADATTAAKQAASGDLFAPVADVLLHPRCINCHTMTDYPRQANDRHRHQFLIMRGADDRGAIGARCTQCHQSENQVGSGVPGAADWRLAPLQMAWETKPGIAMTKAELCRRILDKSRNGFRDLRA